jgi:class 3 adenylate cyclase
MTGFSPKGVLTVDIIDFSLMKNQDQLGAILKLIEFLQSAVPEKENHPSRRVWSPAGDGGSMTFEDIYAALETAKRLAKLINQHNQSPPSDSPPFQVRIGLHSGTVTKEVDFDNRENIWGEGINISARVAGWLNFER